MRHQPVGRYWRRLTDSTGFAGYAQQRDWKLVLSARNLPYQLKKVYVSPGHWLEHLYVPILFEKLSRAELQAFIRENQPSPQTSTTLPLHRNYWLAPGFILPLIIWHGLRVGWWPCPASLPSPNSWQKLGGLDSLAIHFHAQWYRLVTALTLHADLSHITGNIVLGAIFLLFLARLVGPARAAWLTLIGGALGNALIIFFRRPAFASLGFSTAIFASIGILCGIIAINASERKKIYLPLAAAVGFLALLGTEGENVDYGAHIAGLGAGLFLGITTGYRISKKLPLMPEFFAAALYFCLPIVAWLAAFGKLL